MLVQIKNTTKTPFIVKDDVVEPDQVYSMYTAKVGYIVIRSTKDDAKCTIHYDVYRRFNFYEEGNIQCVQVHDSTEPGLLIYIKRKYEDNTSEESKPGDIIIRRKRRKRKKVQNTDVSDLDSNTNGTPNLGASGESGDTSDIDGTSDIDDANAVTYNLKYPIYDTSTINVSDVQDIHQDYNVLQDCTLIQKILAGVVASILPIFSILFAVGIILDINVLKYISLCCLIIPLIIVGICVATATIYKKILMYFSCKKRGS